MKSIIKINKDYIISEVSPSLFGSFIEHIGRSIYGGIYEENKEISDSDNFRKDVIKAVKELNVPLIRYPGGNFLSAYNWKDGIGPKDLRKTRLDLAWKQLEPNIVGIDEFIKWSKKVNSEVILGINMGTGTPYEAGELVEYCNHKGGSFWSEQRIKNGSVEPYNIKYWCIGNEMDGSWQICSMSAEEYGKKANETAKIMKIIDSGIKLIICGSSSPESGTFPEWDRKVLEFTYDNADYLSLHAYYTYNSEHDIREFLASPVDFGNYISKVKATCDYVKALKKSAKTIMLSMDEWNVWHINDKSYEQKEDWGTALPYLENLYDVADSLVVAGLLCVLVNNCDRVKIGCFAQLVNVIAPIITKKGGGLLKQSIYYPIYLFSHNSPYTMALRTVDSIPVYGTKKFIEAPFLHKCVCYNSNTEEYIVFAINVSDQNMDLELVFNENVVIEENILMHNADINIKNTFENPYNIIPVKIETEKYFSKVQDIVLPAYSFSMLKYKASGALNI